MSAQHAEHTKHAEQTSTELPTESEQLEAAVVVAKEQMKTVVRRYPYASVAAGLGVGVVLGGGIPSWALRLAATGLTRIAVSKAVQTLSENELPQEAS